MSGVVVIDGEAFLNAIGVRRIVVKGVSSGESRILVDGLETRYKVVVASATNRKCRVRPYVVDENSVGIDVECEGGGQTDVAVLVVAVG